MPYWFVKKLQKEKIITGHVQDILVTELFESLKGMLRRNIEDFLKKRIYAKTGFSEMN